MITAQTLPRFTHATAQRAWHTRAYESCVALLLIALYLHLTLAQSFHIANAGVTGAASASANNTAGATTYIGQSYYEAFQPAGQSAATQWKHYISSPEGIVAIHTDNLGAAAPTTKYWAKDHLGSIVAEYDEGGAAASIQRYSFDAWGKRRNVTGEALAGAMSLPNNLESASTSRGFTGHEMLDEVGLVHMNGRIYDPLVGRFMQADPIIQDPYLSQSYNRYSYVLNNPLSYADPSGFSWWTKWRAPIMALVAAVATAGAMTWALTSSMAFGEMGTLAFGASTFEAAGLTAAGKAAVALASGFAAVGVGGGNLESAITGAFTALASFGVGEAFNAHGGTSHLSDPMKAGHAGAHAAVGCAGAVMAGGSCRSGAMGAGFSALAGNIEAVAKLGLPGRILVGGLAAKLGGGKFASGALSAAFEYLYNNCDGGKCDTNLEQNLYDYMPGYKVGTGAYNSYQSGSFQFTVEEGLDGVLAAVGAFGKVATAVSGPVKGWFTLGAELDGAFKKLPFFDKIAWEVGNKTVSAAEHAASAGKSALEIGRARIAEVGYLRAMFGGNSVQSVGQFSNTWNTGATAGFRMYGGTAYTAFWYSLNTGATLKRP